MTESAVYTFPLRALRRWREERITLEDQPGGGVSAEFCFEGSTCGNVAFTLRYRVKLSSLLDEHRIVEMSCVPVPGSAGYALMCVFREDADRSLRLLREECPLLGQPLAAALAWRPAISPAGCVCALASRAHKWLAVLQTLHLALSERVTK